MTSLRDLGSFSRLVATLSGWLDRVVIIGGWAHRPYRLHPYAQAVEYDPLTTLDTDVAIPAELPATTEDLRQHRWPTASLRDFWATIGRRQRITGWQMRPPDSTPSS